MSTAGTRIFDVISVETGRVCSTLQAQVRADQGDGVVVGGGRVKFYERCFGPVVIHERNAPMVYGRRGGIALRLKRQIAGGAR